MELRDAIEKAYQILDEERLFPTIKYALRAKQQEGWVGAFVGMGEGYELQFVRSHRPRQIVEDPRRWVFHSTNYNLLSALFSQLPATARPAFLSAMVQRISIPPACARAAAPPAEPSWNGLVSELPLVAEFLVRNAAKNLFFAALGEAQGFPGHVLLIRHLEDMIALNFTLFTDAEYERLSRSVVNLGFTVRKRLVQYDDPQTRQSVHVNWQDFDMDWRACKEIVDAELGIKEQCRKARYLDLKGSLEGFNLEINQDKEAVQSYLERFGFSNTLRASLDEADRLYHEGATPFELKSCMGHLRSFMENLHAEALSRIQPKGAPPPPSGWGPGLTHLRQTGVISKTEVGFAASLYTLISDQAVHPLIAEKEYARLARNIVVEYGLLFLRRIEKVGIPQADPR